MRGQGYVRSRQSLFPDEHICCEHCGILRTGIAGRLKDGRLAEAGSAKLLEEGAAFLRSADSGEPVRLGDTVTGRVRFLHDQFSGIDDSTLPHYPRELREDSVSVRVEIE